MQGKQQSGTLPLNITSRAATAALAMAVVFAVTAVLSQSAQAQTPTASVAWNEKVLHNFGNGTDGGNPYAGLIRSTAGYLYSTTTTGGTLGRGTVFELARTVGGGWTEMVLYSFCISYYNCTDGQNPVAGLIFDAAGNLYGTTEDGGIGCVPGGCGVVFELSPGEGGWIETVLYSFCSQPNCTDGLYPEAGLIFDTAGNLYGTTNRGGTYHGTAFELTPVYPCAKCGHSGLREGDVLPAARRVVLEQGRDRTN